MKQKVSITRSTAKNQYAAFLKDSAQFLKQNSFSECLISYRLVKDSRPSGAYSETWSGNLSLKNNPCGKAQTYIPQPHQQVSGIYFRQKYAIFFTSWEIWDKK